MSSNIAKPELQSCKLFTDTKSRVIFVYNHCKLDNLLFHYKNHQHGLAEIAKLQHCKNCYTCCEKKSSIEQKEQVRVINSCNSSNDSFLHVAFVIIIYHCLCFYKQGFSVKGVVLQQFWLISFSRLHLPPMHECFCRFHVDVCVGKLCMAGINSVFNHMLRILLNERKIYCDC